MPRPFFIRPASSDDSAALSSLYQRSYPELLPADYSDEVLAGALPLFETAQTALLSCGTYFIAECAETDAIVGAGGWTDLSPSRGVSGTDLGHMRHVATRPDWLRRGVARALIDVALASAEAHGMRQMSCMSTYTARPFYEAMGFEEAAEVELTLAPGVHFPAVQMTRRLADPCLA
ncbi:GNAT family N-acetyltransferase [Shimia marina]|uniref:Putative acetyltransferase involved in intracellular survival n=1 Tax=Shimia marina TaxID=321267 RepID=A0A0P1FC12_9RHOB|nr:GNAT family N-acetyltransferase [Shimia marina]CUH52247.1 putative acetyltransferase involved in intracellular survival [Shimia marina]SFE06715.1 Acetyltransferase (GNAT) family protein [Shimia marina]